MSDPIASYWQLRLEETKKALEANNFQAFVTATGQEAKDLVMNTLIPGLAPSVVAFGGSMTVVNTGVHQAVKESRDYQVLDTYEKIDPGKALELRRQALLSDLLITSANAVTEDGCLVNLDGTGNRVAAMAFGPKNLIILAGKNKIVADVDQAVERIKTLAAPINAIRLSRKTPCAKTGECMNCSSPDRICNVWAISEKSSPKHRIKVVLIAEDFGF